MIYLKHTTEPQVAYIPRDAYAWAIDALRMTLRSTVDLDQVYDALVLDLAIHSRFYSIALRLPEDCPTGEYEYQFLSAGAIVSQGVAVVTPDGGGVKQYEKPIQYEQYERE
jgi:hypothetical protein